MSAMSLTACGSDDDNNDANDNNDISNSNNDTEIKGDYTATGDIKTVTLKDYRINGEGEVTIYEDFNNKYNLAATFGQMRLSPYVRKNGEWRSCIQGQYYGTYYYNIGIKDLGEMGSLSDVSEKVEVDRIPVNGHPAAQPGHGYAASFLAKDGTQYLRLYISGYKLDDEGTLENITVQYQLY